MGKKTITRKLREALVSTPSSDAIEQILAHDRRRQHPHKHRWFTPEGSAIEYCRKPGCGAHRVVSDA